MGVEAGPKTPNTNQGTHQQAQGGVADMLGKFSGGSAGGLVGGLAAGGLLATLMGNKKMRKTASKMAGGAVAYGGSAVLGAVALKAYQNWQSTSASAATATQQEETPAEQHFPENFDPSLNVDATGQPMQLALVKSMIAAANADGHIDQKEQAAVFEAVDKMSLAPESKAVIFDVLRNPPSIADVAGYATGLEQASEIYLASRLAIDPDHPLERLYLDDLCQALGLPEGLVREVERQIEPDSTPPPIPPRSVGQFGRGTDTSRVPLVKSAR